MYVVFWALPNHAADPANLHSIAWGAWGFVSTAKFLLGFEIFRVRCFGFLWGSVGLSIV